MRLVRLLFTILGIFLLTAPLAPTKEQQKVKGLELLITNESQQVGVNRKAQVARKLITKGNYEAASALLEEIYEQEPENPVILNLLLPCYDYLGYSVKSEALVRRFIERYPQNVTYRVKLAEVLTKQGDVEGAEATYDEAISLLEKGSVTAYQMVLKSMKKHGFEEKALVLIDTVRHKKGDSTLFALERGTILEAQHQYREAALEYFTVLGDSGRTATNAENQLLSLLEFPESSSPVEQTLLEQTADTASTRAARILASFYLKTEQYDRAFDFVVLQDSLEGHPGTPLLNFARECRERKLYPQAAKMAEYILSRYPNHPIRGEAYILYAEALVESGRYEEALTAYDSIFANAPRPKDQAEALYQIGDIYLNHLQDPARALAVFDSVTTHYQAGIGYLNARLAIPHCYLRQGQIDKARSAFEQMMKRRLNESFQEEIAYHLALIFFFEKKFDSSETALRKLLVDYPRGFYVNDAIQLLLVLDEAAGGSELLYDFSNALLFEQRRMPDSVEEKLLLIVNNRNKALADVSLYKLAQMSMERADSVKAVEYVDQLETEFPDSYYLPYGLKTKADIFVARTDSITQARAIYHRLLENYSDYPFISEVREKMRHLEGEA